MDSISRAAYRAALLAAFYILNESIASYAATNCPQGWWSSTLTNDVTCYYINTTAEVTRAEAMETCKQMGSELTSIGSYDELAMLEAIIPYFDTENITSHTGLLHRASEGDWINIDGHPLLSPIPWSTTSASHTSNGECCAILSITVDQGVIAPATLEEQNCDTKNGFICKGFSECLEIPCNNSLGCKMMNGSKECVCALGYWFNPALQDCQDVDECVAGVCYDTGTCTNTDGSYLCQCKAGYRWDGENLLCTDINECESEPCTSPSQCWNLEGSYECLCGTGLTYVNSTCVDVDECDMYSPCGPTNICFNLDGGFQCAARS